TLPVVAKSDVYDGQHLLILAVGKTSQKIAYTTFSGTGTQPTPSTPPASTSTQRPFWVYGHNPNSVAITETYLQKGVNALEPDIEYFPKDWEDTTDVPHTQYHNAAGFYIAHQLGSQDGLSDYGTPILSLQSYLEQLSAYLQPNQTKLSLVEFDVKTDAA